MADNLHYIAACERGRGRVLAFAHNAHLQRGQVRMPIGPELYTWWPAGAHVAERLGPRYAVVGIGVGVSEDNGIGKPEPGTLEARLTALPGPARLLLTRGAGAAELLARSRSRKNPTYAPLTAQSLSDFDALVVLDSVTCHRGGRPLP